MTATASTRGAPAAWASWAWRSACKRLGGSLIVKSAPGQGTVLKAELPLPVTAGSAA